MPKDRFDVVRTDGIGEILGGAAVTIRDHQTGNEVRADGHNLERATERAWEKLEATQGPTPSKK